MDGNRIMSDWFLRTPLFLDTEFTDWRAMQLIALGLVSESGKSFYCELADTYTRDQCSPFVRAHVLPHLQGGEALLPAADAASRLKAWIESFGVPVYVVTDFPEYDWVLLRRLLAGHWPDNLHEIPYRYDSSDLYQILPSLAAAVLEARKRAYAGQSVHHALHDALALKASWEAARERGWIPGQ